MSVHAGEDEKGFIPSHRVKSVEYLGSQHLSGFGLQCGAKGRIKNLTVLKIPVGKACFGITKILLLERSAQKNQ